MDVLGDRFQRALIRTETPTDDILESLVQARRDVNIRFPHHGDLYNQSISQINACETYCAVARGLSVFEEGAFTASIPSIKAVVDQSLKTIQILDPILAQPLSLRVEQLNTVLDFRHLEQVAQERPPNTYVSGSLDLLFRKENEFQETQLSSSILRTSCGEHLATRLAAVQQIFVQGMNHFVETRAEILFGEEDDTTQDLAEDQLVKVSRSRPDAGEGNMFRDQLRLHGLYSYQTAEGLWDIQIGDTQVEDMEIPED